MPGMPTDNTANQLNAAMASNFVFGKRNERMQHIRSDAGSIEARPQHSHGKVTQDSTANAPTATLGDIDRSNNT